MLRKMSAFVPCVLLLFLTVEILAHDVRFYMFSRANPENHIQITPENLDSTIQSTNKIVIIIHGWTENRTTQWYDPLKNALLARDDCVVIQTDYGKVASQRYLAAVLDSPRIGDEIGDFIVSLTQKNVPFTNIQVIGHSLGGQVAGYAGSHVHKVTSQKIAKIVALDPAGPLFQGFLNLNKKTLDKTDAEIVSVIHTDRFQFGQSGTIGTIDIFPNGGRAVQPGCPEKGDTKFCSHHRSYWYYIDAVENPGTLLATRCDNYKSFLALKCVGQPVIDIAGDFTSSDAGTYFLQTKEKKPYSVETDSFQRYYYYTK